MNTFRIRTCALALSAAVALSACSDILGSRTGNVSEILVIVPSIVLGVGETMQLRARVMEREGTRSRDYTVTWRSRDKSVVTVDSKGLVRARGRGIARVTATAGNREWSTVLQVYDAKVKLVPDSLVISLADSLQVLGAATYDGDRHLVGESARFTIRGTGVVALRPCDGRCSGSSRGTTMFVTPLNVGTARVVVEWLGASDTAVVRITP